MSLLACSRQFNEKVTFREADILKHRGGYTTRVRYRTRVVTGPTAQAFHWGTLRTMFHIIPSSALSISSCGSVRVFVRAAQHIPVAVRAMRVVEPGKLPLCHKLPEPTIQPRAYLAAEVLGKAGLGVVIT